jgi:hypothetical protein
MMMTAGVMMTMQMARRAAGKTETLAEKKTKLLARARGGLATKGSSREQEMWT